MRDFVKHDLLQKELGEVPEEELAEAYAELDADGFLTSSHTMSEKLPHVQPTADLYATFDPIAHGNDPVADAVTLIGRVLAGEDSVSVPELHQATDWPKRRFNPALELVVAEVGEGRVSKTWDGNYPTRSFHLMAEDRVALRLRDQHAVAPAELPLAFDF